MMFDSRVERKHYILFSYVNTRREYQPYIHNQLWMKTDGWIERSEARKRRVIWHIHFFFLLLHYVSLIGWIFANFVIDSILKITNLQIIKFILLKKFDYLLRLQFFFSPHSRPFFFRDSADTFFLLLFSTHQLWLRVWTNLILYDRIFRVKEQKVT